MKKLILSCSSAVCSLAISATAAIISVEAKSPNWFLDKTSPQVIEKIDGNIVTFANAAGESSKSYIPTWMFPKFNLQVGTSVNLFDSNMDQANPADLNIKKVPPKVSKADTSAPNKARSACILVPVLELAICPNQNLE